MTTIKEHAIATTRAIEALQGNTLARATVDLAQTTRTRNTLGPNQLIWLRTHIPAFRHAQDQRQTIRRDVWRALVMAKLS